MNAWHLSYRCWKHWRKVNSITRLHHHQYQLHTGPRLLHELGNKVINMYLWKFTISDLKIVTSKSSRKSRLLVESCYKSNIRWTYAHILNQIWGSISCVFHLKETCNYPISTSLITNQYINRIFTITFGFRGWNKAPKNNLIIDLSSM